MPSRDAMGLHHAMPEEDQACSERLATFEEMAAMMDGADRHALLTIAYNSIRIALQREGQVQHLVGNENCLTSALVALTLALDEDTGRMV